MEYFTYKRFKGKGIDGNFNIPYGTIVSEINDFLYTADGKCICVVTSENGWEHFRPNTKEGKYRQELLNKLYDYYEKDQAEDDNDDFNPDKWIGATNTYWKNLLRTMPTEALINYYEARLGKVENL